MADCINLFFRKLWEGVTTETHEILWSFLKARCSGHHRPTCLRAGENDDMKVDNLEVHRASLLPSVNTLPTGLACRKTRLHPLLATACPLVEQQPIQSQLFSCPIATSHANCWGRDPRHMSPLACPGWPMAAVPCNSAGR